MDTIELTGFRVDTVMGVLDAEQRTIQPLHVEIALELPFEAAARTGDLSCSINYAAVQEWFCTLAQQGRWRLLESMALAACRMLLAPPGPGEDRAAIERVCIVLRKPTILKDAIPGVRVEREAAWCELDERDIADGVRVGTLEATPVQGAWRVVLASGARFAVPATWSLHVLGGRGELGGSPLAEGQVVARAPGREVVAGPSGMTLLAVGSPA